MSYVPMKRKKRRTYTTGSVSRGIRKMAVEKQRAILRGTAGRVSYAQSTAARSSEVKGVDVTINDANIGADLSTNDDTYLLNGVQQGTGCFNRIGKKIKLKSLRLKGYFQALYTPNDESGRVDGVSVRMVVLYDNEATGTTLPVGTDILQNLDQGGATGNTNLLALPNYFNMERFRILRDMTISLNPGTVGYQIAASGTTTGEGQLSVQVPIDEYIKLEGLDTVYSATANPVTYEEINKGALIVRFVSNTLGSQSLVNVAVGTRVRYYD